MFHDGDADGDVDLHDFIDFQVCFDTVDPGCLAAHDFDDQGVSDGVIDAADWAGIEHCYSNPELAPPPDCTPQAPSPEDLPPTGTFALHGRPIDVLSDGQVLYDFRARYYDPQHGRWLQRDPSGYGDGNNLYESFRANALRFTDPDGRYTRLASGWNNGDEILYQHFPWLSSSQPAESFSVGRYFIVDGRKVVLYAPAFDDYAYALPFERVEEWSRQVVDDEFDYREWVKRCGTRIDRYTGKTVERSTWEDLGCLVETASAEAAAAMDETMGVMDPSLLFAGPLMTVLTAETTRGLLVDEARTVSKREYAWAAVNTALLPVLPAAAMAEARIATQTGRVLSLQARAGAVDRSIGTYEGIKQASRYLRNMGVSRAKRVEILRSLIPETVRVEVAGPSLHALRFYGGGKAPPMGQYLFETFSPLTNRANLALPRQFNTMTAIQQWRVRPGAVFFRGRVAPQLEYGAQFIGGAEQIFVLEPWKYGTLLPVH